MGPGHGSGGRKRCWTAQRRWDYDYVTVVGKGRIRTIRLGWASDRLACVCFWKLLRTVSRFGVLGVLAVIVVVFPAVAQQGHTPPPPTGAVPDSLDQPGLLQLENPDPFSLAANRLPMGDLSGEIGRMKDNESCNSWTESSVNSPTVSLKRLGVTGKAQGEYQRGCGALKGKRWAEAEDHLRRAVDIYPDYAAAWVLLGQALISEKKSEDAKKACDKAKEIDPGYVASYLCLAEFAANESNWPEVAKASAAALDLDPIGNPYSLYYAADAGLHQRQLSQAEMHAQTAVKLDTWHHIPELHMLLAQIYQEAGNVVGEAAQLKEFLKYAANSKDAPLARSMLALVETTPAKPPAEASGQSPN